MLATPAASPTAGIPQGCTASSPDQTHAIQQLIDATPDGSTVNLPANACYRVEGTLELKDRNNITVHGNGTTLVSLTDGTGYVSNLQTRKHIFLYGGSNLNFDHLNIVGDAPSPPQYHAKYAGQSGFWVWGTQGLTITDSTIRNVRGDFVTLGPDTYRSWEWTNGVTLTGDDFNGAGRQGIALTGAENVLVQNTHAANSAANMIDIESDSKTGKPVNGVPTYGGAANIRIDSNQFGRAGGLFLGNYGYCADTSGITVTGNMIYNPLSVQVHGCATVHRTGITISGNTAHVVFSSASRAAIELTYVDGGSIDANTIPFYAPIAPTAVRVYGSSNITVTNNRFPGAGAAVQIDRNWSGPPSSNITATGNCIGSAC